MAIDWKRLAANVGNPEAQEEYRREYMAEIERRFSEAMYSRKRPWWQVWRRG